MLLLHKTRYGHRKAPALWNKEIDSTLISLGFTSSPGDACLYTHSSHPLFLILHVDDFIIAGNQSSLRDDIIASLSVKYGIKCLGEVTRFTNYQVSRDRSKREIYLYQRDYIAEILTLSGMQDCYGTKTKGSLFTSGLSPSLSTADIVEQEGNIAYRQLTGGLIHLSCHSRPDIAYEAASLSKHNTAPTAQHWTALKQLLRYLKYTADDYLVLGGFNPTFIIHGYADSSYNKDKHDHTAPQGYVFFMDKSLIAHKSRWSSKIYP